MLVQAATSLLQGLQALGDGSGCYKTAGNKYSLP